MLLMLLVMLLRHLLKLLRLELRWLKLHGLWLRPGNLLCHGCLTLRGPTTLGTVAADVPYLTTLVAGSGLAHTSGLRLTTTHGAFSADVARLTASVASAGLTTESSLLASTHGSHGAIATKVTRLTARVASELGSSRASTKASLLATVQWTITADVARLLAFVASTNSELSLLLAPVLALLMLRLLRVLLLWGHGDQLWLPKELLPLICHS